MEVSPIFLRIHLKKGSFTGFIFSKNFYEVYPENVIIGGMYLVNQPQ